MKVEFWVFIGNELTPVSAELDDSLATLFTLLKKDVNAAELIPTNVTYSVCDFYWLNSPVSLDQDDLQQDDDFLDQVKRTCLEESNRMHVNPILTKVRRLAATFFSDHVYLVIELPDPFGESNRVIGKLRQDHGTMFKCLQVTVKNLKVWRKEDVMRNLQGGILTTNIGHLVPAFLVIQDALEQPRVYRATDCVTQKRDFQNALSYGTQFHRVFTPGKTESRIKDLILRTRGRLKRLFRPHSHHEDTSSTRMQTVISNREFAAFYNILRCFAQDAEMIADRKTSSSLKAGNFTVHFIQPPFFSEIHDDSHGFEYK